MFDAFLCFNCFKKQPTHKGPASIKHGFYKLCMNTQRIKCWLLTITERGPVVNSSWPASLFIIDSQFICSRVETIYQLFRPTMFKQRLSLAGKGKYSPSRKSTHIQCDKLTSVTHNAVSNAIVRGSADQTLHGALLQIQATILAVLLPQEDKRQAVVTKVIVL